MYCQLHLLPAYVLPVAHVTSCTFCQLHILPVARFASCMCCQLHVLPVPCLASCPCCQLHVLPVARVVSRLCCQLHMLRVASVVSCMFSSCKWCQLHMLPVANLSKKIYQPKTIQEISQIQKSLNCRKQTTGWSNWTGIRFDLITLARKHPMKWYRSPFSPDIRTFWYIVSKNSNRFYMIFTDWGGLVFWIFVKIHWILRMD